MYGRKHKSLCQKACLMACFWPVIGVYYCVKYTCKAASATVKAKQDFSTRRHVKRCRLPKSKPLATASSSSSPPETTSSPSRTPTSFLHLPLELRQEIYRLALGPPAIAQIQVSSSFWGPRPSHWGPDQRIRDDADPPGEALRTITGLGGSGLDQLVFPPSHGCVRHGAVSQLICGDRHHFAPRWVHPRTWVCWTDLMRASRSVYVDALDVLYANNTISLFGADIARYFCRNASPEGLARVRFVHVAYVMQSNGWDSSAQRKSVQESMNMLRNSLPNLRQLDIEVALTWSQPKDPRRLWTWLMDHVLGQFRGLEKFVLKVSVYKPLTPQGYYYNGRWGWMPDLEPLRSWDEDEYQALNFKVTSYNDVVSS
ncbi:hypothetical protein F4804DRAFT_321219 [Jackrogersella minutella]|nr:hypothetical protein F4804DRAFT_321219 [Jackrogersella minutella]